MYQLVFGVPDQSFFDSYWTLIHFFSGVLTGVAIIMVYRMNKRPLPARVYGRIGISLLIIWEYFEIVLRFLEKYHPPLADLLTTVIPESFFGIESKTNIIADLVVGSLGLYLVYRYLYNRRGSKTSLQS